MENTSRLIVLVTFLRGKRVSWGKSKPMRPFISLNLSDIVRHKKIPLTIIVSV